MAVAPMTAIELAKKPSVIIKCLMANYRARLPSFLWGPPGTAKSALMMMIASHLGMAYADIRVASMDVLDLRGLPYHVVENNQHRMMWSAPMVLPHMLDLNVMLETPHAEPVELSWINGNPLGDNNIHYIQQPKIEIRNLGSGYTPVILKQTPVSVEIAFYENDAEGKPTDKRVPGKCRVFVTGAPKVWIGLDEFSGGDRAAIIAAYQLILDGRVGPYRVPPDCYIMAAGNRLQDNAIATEMGTAAWSRFVHMTIMAHAPSWIEWGMENDLDDTVLSFIAGDNDQIMIMPAANAEEPFRCPRTWHYVSRIVQSHIEDDGVEVLTSRVKGAVGAIGGGEFMTHLAEGLDLPKAGDILEGTVAVAKFEPKISTGFQMVSRMINELRRRKVDSQNPESGYTRAIYWEQGERFIGFMMRNPQHFPPELLIMAIRQAVFTYELGLSGKGSNMRAVVAEHHTSINKPYKVQSLPPARSP